MKELSKKKCIYKIMVTVMGTLLLICCSKKGTDYKSKKIEASRIVVLSPSGAEILSYINAENLIIARSSFCDYPESLLKIPSIGGFSQDTLSIETILSYKPDFVYGSKGIHDSIKETLEKMNVNVYLSESKDIEDILREIEFIGTVTNHAKESSALIQNLRLQIESLKEKTSTLKKSPSIYWEVWNSPYITATNKSFINDVIKLAGGKNIFDDVDDVYPIISEEIIIKRNPDVIIIPKENNISLKLIKNRPGWKNISAIQNERIIFVNSDLFSRPGPRIISAAEELFNELKVSD